ncbi:galactosyl transferase GMA12/MNN10 domain protein [Burkholderia sp. LS-044]|uniref:galactosyl transferase GMA12/MNN10 domain protein n=1 Tax=Burkholderia sp. LS-044 TaxID=1459967 RepID=UPI0010A5F5FA|nr:galactosyl transferase GMA12/MNN10 domain protein [Burkholderia sp. LS-044]THJ46814.1 galactosyl transferase GMA12/MNN10 domain protein [Burkholderia sp. LS-044]
MPAPTPHRPSLSAIDAGTGDVTVISCFSEPAPASLANHRHYAAALGYRHACVDMSDGPRGPQLQALHRYEYLLATLESVAENHLVLLLAENAAIVQPVALPRLMTGRDHLIVATSDSCVAHNVQVWRNTPAIRARVRAVAACCRLGGEPFVDETRLLAAVTALPWHETIDGVCAVMPAGPNVDPHWSRIPTFAISLDTAMHSPPELGIVPRFRETLFGHIHRCQLHGGSLFDSALPRDTEPLPERSTFQPGHPIALVTLYTPDIACYGSIAERNFKRYCERHGYTLHVHRDSPGEVGLAGTGNWLKPWLLHAYLAHHEWVIWVDADVLIADHNRALEPLLAQRTQLLAKDIGQWPFNAGVMGFRRTDANLAMLAELMQRIAALPDRSGVYAGNGDQFHFIEAMREHNLLHEALIDNPLLFNTPWFMRGPGSFIVHYFGMWTQMRALMMACDDRC